MISSENSGIPGVGGRSIARRTVSAVLLAGLMLGAGPVEAAFDLREPVGRHWRNERVVFPLTADLLRQAKAGHSLNGPDNRPIPYQLLPATDTAPDSVTFMVDLPPYAAQTYRFSSGRIIPATDLQVSETAEGIRLVNGPTGIEIRKNPAPGQGPIARIKLTSGVWVGDSQLLSDLPLTQYSAEVSFKGPVFAEVICRAVLGSDSTWGLRIRLNAGEPTVLVEEMADVKSGQTRFRLDLRKDFDPTHVFHRRGWQDGFRFALAPLNPGRVFMLEPWQNWFASQTQGASFSLVRIGAGGAETDLHGDLLAVGAGRAGLWIDPDMPQDQRQPANAVLTCDGEGRLHLDFVLKSGRREWLISALDAHESLEKKEANYLITPLPFQHVIKHGHFPLNRVKDQVHVWEHAAVEYPRLLVPRADVDRFRARLTQGEREAYQRRIPGVLNRVIDRYYLDEPIEVWCATGDKQVAQHIIEGAERHMQEALDCFLVQSVPYGSAPHMTAWLGTAMTLADAALGTGLMTPEQRERLLARAAFVAYAISRPDYWCTARGYQGLPNMTTSVYGYLAAAASLVSPHPKANDWGWNALGVLRWQLNAWSDENGGWLEAPHYAGVSFDAILGALAMAYNAGISDWLHTEPRVTAVANWFGKISTPPDSRINDIRHLPHLGHTYLFEPTGLFGTMAYLFRNKSPAFAAQMQWMWKQQGSYGQPGIASMYPTMAGYRSVMTDPTIQETPPAWQSEWFPKTGVILRNGFPDPRETQLYMIAGAHRSHYDDDSGAITLWGKGRIVADMFGYGGSTPAQFHSLVESPRRARVMNVETFAVTDTLDYVSGLAGGWRRQIAFVKDADLLGPNYFMISDSFDQATSPTWRLWLSADNVVLDGQDAGSGFQPKETPSRRVRVIGKEDVDTDIFFTGPATPVLKTEQHARPAGAGLHPNFSFGPMAITQIVLLARDQNCQAVTAVVYPRLKTEAVPEFTSLADGRGVKVAHAAGIDYVFLSPVPITFREGDIAFEGTVGSVALRKDRMTLSLGAAGEVTARGQRLAGDKAASQSWKSR